MSETTWRVGDGAAELEWARWAERVWAIDGARVGNMGEMVAVSGTALGVPLNNGEILT
jgi:hypothetical protein